MKALSAPKNSLLKPFVITGIFILCAAVLGGIYYFKPSTITTVMDTYENGVDKEVWIYYKAFMGKKEKIKEISYFKDGTKESEREYKNDKVNGWARMWFENGQLHMEATYIDNKVHGTRTAYHKNGQKFCVAEYDNGKILGKKNWDEKGNEIYLPIDRE